MLSIPDWASGLLGMFATLLVVLGGVVGSILTYRVKNKAQKNAALAEESSRENMLIDQLQEELTQYRKINDARSTLIDKRLERMEEENRRLQMERNLYRAYAHSLRGHIHDGLGPPPPEWPEGITP